MSHDFAYRCPHCGETIRIADEVMGQVVDCPMCESPFKVDVPTALPADPSTIHDDLPGIEHPDRAEGELKSVHPAMFRTHPVAFIGYWAMVIVGGAAIVLAMWNYEFISQTFQIVAGSVLALIGAILLLKWWLETIYTQLTVTSKRTILRKGIIAKQTTEVQHDDVRNIQVDQNIYERLAGVGDLAISSSGQDELEIQVHGIPRPNEVAEIIRDMQ
jgi:DNA-directed RNA polymerase subunit RPC12/RpoP